ncbi:replicative DNA helicase [Lactobacillus sp. PV037]|uniref:replicative DNA helicase n=1 Tax=Lactobacillus sp. PV037 TaxID=2594496 RepID=UPI0022400917|nr:replicative DNA helicase [Lactobacillus sp. PV037]QNQ84348.1 replicative DNA helicase [Lactobacillus sp. PV037]
MDNVVSQQVPHDSVAEKAVLGAAFLDPSTLGEVSGIISADDFYTRANQLVFAAMLELFENGEGIDPITLKNKLEQEDHLEDIGGIKYITDVLVTKTTTVHSNYYAKIIKNKSLLRKLIDTSQTIIQTAMDEKDEVGDILDEAESSILKISQEKSTTDFKKIGEVVKETITQINELSEAEGGVTGLPTGFTELDRMTTGFHNDELIILAARPGVGKTAFALNVAQYVGLHANKTVGMFSLEMGADQLVQRMIASTGLIDSQHLRTGNLSQEEYQNFFLATDKLAQTNIYIDDTPGIKISELSAKARNLANKSKGNLGLIVIDYLQLIEGPRSESRQQEVSAISRQLKKLAKELHIPIIALSQLSRSVEQRQDKRPVLSDIRESGSIEQDADIVAFLYRDDYYRDEREDGESDPAQEKDSGEVEVIIEKNRSGSRGTVKLMFSKPFNRFSNLDTHHQLNE